MPNKVVGAALVTGAASGIGRASATALVQRGFPVVVADVDEENGNKVVEELKALPGGKAIFVKLDVTNESEWQNAVKITLEKYEKLQVLVNNAGIGGPRVSVEDNELADYERTIAVTQTSVFLGCKSASKALFECGNLGSVVNISSIMAASGGNGKLPAYSAAKGAVRSMTKNIAVSWATKGVRVNSVHPGFINTPMLKKGTGQTNVADLIALHPLGRLGEPEEVAKAVAFLATDDSSFVTGSELYVDGGFMAK